MKVTMFLGVCVVIIMALAFSLMKMPTGNVVASSHTDVPTASAADCTTRVEERVVRGTSLSPMIADGSDVRLLYGYYDCRTIERGDVVAYNYSGNPEPIIKIVKAVPGDSFELVQNGGWNIIVDGAVVKNSEGSAYSLTEQGRRMLSLYVRDYHGIVPANAYLILGDAAGGSLDSTRFGLVDKSDILAKVEY